MLLLRPTLPILLAAAVATAACRSDTAATAAWATQEPRSPSVILSWTAGDAEQDQAAFYPLLDTAQFESMWIDVIVRPGSARRPSTELRPSVDFRNCVGFALTAGATWNMRGYSVRSIENLGGEWHVRLDPITYQSKQAGRRDQPYGIFLLTRVPGATIVVDENVTDEKGRTRWVERGRVRVPKLAQGEYKTGAAETAGAEPEAGAELAALVLESVRDYRSYPRVSDCPAWSPLSCMAPPQAGAFVSASDDPGTHGRKLYYLFAKDRAAYNEADGSSTIGSERGSSPSAPKAPAPIGQVLVKESWNPVPVEALDGAAERGWGLPEDHATSEGRLYKRGDQRELFVMLKLDPATPGTDGGWVYATVTPDRAKVTSVGRVASCMGCHVTAEHDRQFGIPEGWVGMRRKPGP